MHEDVAQPGPGEKQLIQKRIEGKPMSHKQDKAARRKALGLPLVRFVAELGVSAKTVSACEHGKITPNEIVSERILNLVKDQE